MNFLSRFLKVLFLFLIQKRVKIIPFFFLFTLFIILMTGVVFMKNEIYFLNLKAQRIEKEIQKEKEKYEYLHNIFLDLTSYEKLIQVVDIKKFEKDNLTINITIER